MHVAGARCHAVGGGIYQGFDLFRRLSATARQVTHFACYDGKPASLLTGTRRLDGGVQRQNVGLESYAVNHAGDIANFSRRDFNGLHGADRLRYHLAAARRSR